MSDLRNEVYRTIFETWRSQVDSYWQRTNYFAAFETAALGGCWYVIEHVHAWTGLVFSVAGFLSTVAWLISSLGVHRYINYWKQSVQHVEHELLLREHGFDFMTRHPGSGLHPSRWIHLIPILFMGAWVAVFIFAIHGLLVPPVVAATAR